jgi:hypothetical protein
MDEELNQRKMLDYNEKTMLRDVICIKCRMIKLTTEVDPHCEICGNIMITTVRSTVTGELITGEDKSGKWTL